jgi:hypothetical protein
MTDNIKYTDSKRMLFLDEYSELKKHILDIKEKKDELRDAQKPLKEHRVTSFFRNIFRK